MKLSIVNSVMTWVMRKRFSQIEYFMSHSQEVQHQWLERLLYMARDTEWGKKYDFASIKNYETFKERIPLSKYENIEADINRIKAGEQNILWPSEIKWFAKSSGTTSSKSKFIPVSFESLEECHFKGGKDLLSIYCNNYPETNIFSGKSLRLGGSHSLNSIDGETYSGDLSAIIIENLPIWAEFKSTPSNKISLMNEWEKKMTKIAKTTIDEDVTSLAGVPSWMMVLLNHVLDITGKDNLLEIWPNLELYMHGGVDFTPYREQYKRLIPKEDMHYAEIYNASEGFFGIQDLTDRNEMLLMLDYGIFYEFIPMDEYKGLDSNTIPLEQVELDKNYAMVITTNAGLWRYLIGDTVKFTSVNPYRVKVSGRTKHYINAFGEEVIIENAEEALLKACKATGAEVKDFTAAPLFMQGKEKGAHEWLFEFNKQPNSLSNFIETFDKSLQEINSDYEAKRYNNMTLNPPKVHVAKDGLFYNWLKQKGKLGGQNKVPRLSNTREYIDELLELNNA